MGDWARKTRLRWRWREFWFEPFHTTPKIFLDSRKENHARELVILNGTRNSRDLSFASGDSSHLRRLPNNSHERVCWLPLLDDIYDVISSISMKPGRLEGCQTAADRFQESSWDFQLPDVVRPLAKISVETIAIIARRRRQQILLQLWRHIRRRLQ